MKKYPSHLIRKYVGQMSIKCETDWYLKPLTVFKRHRSINSAINRGPKVIKGKTFFCTKPLPKYLFITSLIYFALLKAITPPYLY